jgi:hypothetical protein
LVPENVCEKILAVHVPSAFCQMSTAFIAVAPRGNRTAPISIPTGAGLASVASDPELNRRVVFVVFFRFHLRPFLLPMKLREHHLAIDG